MFISVLLPEPEGPISATYSPCSIVSVAFLSASTLTSPRSYTLQTSRISIKDTIDLPKSAQIKRKLPQRFVAPRRRAPEMRRVRRCGILAAIRSSRRYPCTESAGFPCSAPFFIEAAS